MNLVERLHGDYAHHRRMRKLSGYLGDLIPQSARVLDVGCGDGLIASFIMKQRPDIEVSGIDVLVRGQTHIPVTPFNGEQIPFADGSIDAVMFVDVLHHTENPLTLLHEAIRTSRRFLIIKDHTCNGLFASPTLRFMDRIGNARYGVSLPYNYWPQQRWLDTFNALDLSVGIWRQDLRLYPPPASWIFDRSLHFIARLDLNRQEMDLRVAPCHQSVTLSSTAGQ